MGSPNNIPRWNGFYANSRIPLYVRKGDWWSPSLSRFSLNRPTASLKKGSSPFRGENFRCYSTCFSSNLELDKGETCIPSQGRSKMIAPVVDFLGSLPPLIYTHLFSLRFRWTTSSVNNRYGRCRRNWKIHVRADTDRPIHPNVNIGQTTEPPPYF